jgi:hypothetical protein
VKRHEKRTKALKKLDRVVKPTPSKMFNLFLSARKDPRLYKV